MPRKRKRSKPQHHIIRTSVRLLARLSSIISIVLMIIIFKQTDLHPPGLPPKDLVLFICFPVAVAFGFLIAWAWELTGSVISLLGFAVFCLLHFAFVGVLPTGIVLLSSLIIPALLFLLAGTLSPDA